MKTVLVVLALLQTGCGGILTPCPGACSTLYSEGECNIQSPGRSQDELMDLCLEQCNAGWSVAKGEAGDYDPTQPTPSSEVVTLENRAMVKLWEDCVDSTSCDEMADDICAPVW